MSTLRAVPLDARQAPTPSPLILIVDDNLDSREMYSTYLAHAGFRALEAADGESAIAQAEGQRPALIVMDAAMPGLDGWEAARRLKSAPGTMTIPLIMLTSHAFAQHRDRAAAVGSDLFLAKPILPDELARHISRLLRPS